MAYIVRGFTSFLYAMVYKKKKFIFLRVSNMAVWKVL